MKHGSGSTSNKKYRKGNGARRKERIDTLGNPLLEVHFLIAGRIDYARPDARSIYTLSLPANSDRGEDRHTIQNEAGLYFRFGQEGTVWQHVIRGSDVFCAKVGRPETIKAEVRASRLVHEKQKCPSVMPVLDVIEIDENRYAMLSPLYPFSLSLMSVNETTIINVALCGLATVKAFSNKELCHGDIKPSNMMFQAGSRTVVTIDFGSCMPYGNMLTATSDVFGMGCWAMASLECDLTCLAASIMLLSGFTFDDFSTREEARSNLQSRVDPHSTIAMLCLDDNVVAVDDIWAKCKTLVEVSLSDADWLVDLDYIWPKIQD